MTIPLYTKHRPTKLEAVIGQDHILKSLKRVAEEKQHHAFIFSGPSGTGKTTIARILAAKFAGEKASSSNTVEIDAASHSGADSIRDIVSRSYFRAMGASPIKSFIVDEAHRLSSTAWDVLLKPTEEPPSHIYWMFCTTNPDKIPKTIQTRAIRYDLKPVDEDSLFMLLAGVVTEEKMQVSDEILLTVAENSGGSPRQALVYLEACAGANSASEARQIMRSGLQAIEAIDLCRWLISGHAQNWAEAVKYVKAVEGLDPETIRISVVNYISAVLLNTKDPRRGKYLLSVLEPFLQPYNQSDKMAPLLHSIGLAIGLDRA